jgi:hypothetical protein
MKRVQTFRSPKDLGGRLPRKRPKRAKSNIDGRVKATANGAPDVVDQRSAGFVADIIGNLVKFAGNDVLGERFGL